MNRQEIGAAALCAVLGAAVVVAILTWTPQLAAGGYSNAASNLLGILAGPSLVGALAYGVWRRWHNRCAAPGCLRLGEHPVDGCVAKVCSVHHTKDDHESVWKRLHVPGALSWGQSHHLNRQEDER